ncbi:hypothetical protein AQZ52_12975 [Novosphingobium fuchskuhlense]|uniref:Uncharacterized protein n=2 Tax=Novosphingobium fuchskuhlense TaxID=1117702 RepID=A0A117UTW8_9SPHN|nr:hypothetical protein AQZ52_12975 [Novosphingobium fuchskuhlense]
MVQGSEIAGEAGLPGDESQGTARAVRDLHPLRAMTVSALRFASVLIGAGLLLRTASSEQVISAAPDPGHKPDTRQPQRFRPAALPEPAFGFAEPGLRDLAPSHALANPQPRHRRDARTQTAVDAIAPTQVAAVPGDSAKGFSFAAGAHDNPDSRPAVTQRVATPTALAANTALPEKRLSEKPAFGKPAPAKSVGANVSSSGTQRAEPAAGLLTPVRIASGAPASRPMPVMAPVAQQPAAPQTVQISLAIPVMRPGPRTTALTTDVHAAMHRPASAWDYAEALPPELAGRPAAMPRTAAVQPAAAALPVTVPAKVAALAAAEPSSSPAAAPPAAKPAHVVLRQNVAPSAASAPATPPVAAASPAPAGKPSENTVAAATIASPPRLALLDRPSVPREHGLGQPSNRRSLAAIDPKAGRADQVPLLPGRSARPAQPLGDDRRSRLSQYERSVVAANMQSGSVDRGPDVRLTSGLTRVSATSSNGSGGTAIDSDATGNDGNGTSLRDRMPLPAFGMAAQ